MILNQPKSVILNETQNSEESFCLKSLQYKKIIFFLMMFSLSQPLFSQVNIAVSKFSNESDVLYLDAWERSVPALLRSYLSDADDVIVLDRDRLDKVLDEQALSLSGLVDSSQVQSIGKILGAEFILAGKIDRQGREIVISADLIRVKTGQIQTEIVRSVNRDYKEAMVGMLANNILYRLTGQGAYQKNKMFKSNSIWYWAGATLLLSGATIATNTYQKENLDKYRSATELKDFDTYYNRANDSKNLVNVLAILAGSAAIGTFVDWLSGDDENEIKSGHAVQASVKSNFYLSDKNEIQLGLSIHF
jgi:TolB-like protein